VADVSFRVGGIGRDYFWGKTLDQIKGNVEGVRKGALEDEEVLEVVEGLWGGVQE